MNLNNNPIIIGIDHGYGNIKTAHTCFRTGVTVHDREPTFKNDLLIFNGKYYTIGEGHKEFAADKMTDGDYYILTLAAIGRELNIRKITSARIHLAAGLPLTWVSEQKDAFRAYLLQKEIADFTFRDVDYHVEFAGADIFPQGFAAVAANLRDFTGTNMLCDIGNGTMNVMYINERRPVPDKCYTEKFGTHQCMLAVRESVLRQFGKVLDDATIERVLRHGKADIADRYLTAIRETAAEYVSGIFRRLREHEYDPELMKLHVVGGGSCLVKNFGDYEKSRVIFNDDICATAKGYELLAERRMRKTGGIQAVLHQQLQKLLLHRQMQTKYIISVFVSLFSMRLLTPQLRALKTLLLKNSALTRLSLTSRTHRAIRLLALQSVTSLFLQIMTLFSVTVLRLFRLHTRQHRLFLFSVLRLQTTAQLLIWQSGQAFRV